MNKILITTLIYLTIANPLIGLNFSQFKSASALLTRFMREPSNKRTLFGVQKQLIELSDKVTSVNNLAYKSSRQIVLLKEVASKSQQRINELERENRLLQDELRKVASLVEALRHHQSNATLPQYPTKKIAIDG